MKIISYESNAGPNDLHFPKMNFSRLNLIVGDSGTGKTRLLNTIFNGALMAVQKAALFVGYWDITFEHQNQLYRWVIQTGGEKGNEKIQSEKIAKLSENGEEQVLVKRTQNTFIFNGKELPKLGPRQTSIALLQEEDLIKPLYLGFSSIMRRSFWGQDLQIAVSLGSVPQIFLEKIKKSGNKDDLFPLPLSLNGRLYILSQYFKDTYDRICKEFMTVFPFVLNYDLLDTEKFGVHLPGFVPVFAVQERHLGQSWIPLDQLSSGMQKVLLILTDIFTMPESGAVYLVDEYENSLGISAINFFPSILLESSPQSQFIMTSHHPYIIGNVPVKSWIVLHRKGKKVLFKQGEALEERYSRSKQKAFVQLINDPFFTEGVE
jgi:energy-coupling factor transporter ATP-binding protein EcfA2